MGEFNLPRYILKLIFSIGLSFFFVSKGSESFDDKGFFYLLAMGFVMFLLLYFIATAFGFCLNATGNYLVAAIVFLIGIAVLSGLSVFVAKMGKAINIIASIAVVAGLFWLPIRDVKNLVRYSRNEI